MVFGGSVITSYLICQLRNKVEDGKQKIEGNRLF